MKILWHSNAPMVGSGYGVQSALFGPRLAGLGHDVAFSANWGVQGWCAMWEGFRVYPADGVWGNRTMCAVAAHHADGDDVLVVALCDAFVFNTDAWTDDIRVALWAPVDHDPIPDAVRAVLADERVTPVAMSRFGERMMVNANLEPLYVPHGIDTALFAPRPATRAAVRREMGLPEDAFVVGMVAANQGNKAMHRKGFAQAFQAFARFRDTHRDAILYVHTNEHPSGSSGLMLRKLAERCGLPRQAVVFTELFAWELGWSRETLSDAYQAFDVFLNPAMGEGFGVGIIEAQACGVPVIVTDFSAMPELVGAGWAVEYDLWDDGYQESWWAAPRVASIVDALEQSYATAGLHAEAARSFALAYDADTVTADAWVPALEALEPARERVAA